MKGGVKMKNLIKEFFENLIVGLKLILTVLIILGLIFTSILTGFWISNIVGIIVLVCIAASLIGYLIKVFE